MHTQTFKDIEEINKKVMTKKLQQDKEASKNTLGDANEKLQELKIKWMENNSKSLSIERHIY